MIYICEEGCDYQGSQVMAVSTDYELVRQFAENLAKQAKLKLSAKDYWHWGFQYVTVSAYEDLKDIK